MLFIKPQLNILYSFYVLITIKGYTADYPHPVLPCQRTDVSRAIVELEAKPILDVGRPPFANTDRLIVDLAGTSSSYPKASPRTSSNQPLWIFCMKPTFYVNLPLLLVKNLPKHLKQTTRYNFYLTQNFLVLPKIVSTWSSLNMICSEIHLKLSMAFNRTSSISSLNISTKKSKERFANCELFNDNWHKDSTAADLTSNYVKKKNDLLYKKKKKNIIVT